MNAKQGSKEVGITKLQLFSWMVFFLSVHSEGEQTADEVSVDFINLWSVIIPYNGAIRKEGGYPERDGGGEEEEEELHIFI